MKLKNLFPVLVEDKGIMTGLLLAVVTIAMFTMPTEAWADGFSWNAETKTLTVTGTDIASNIWPIVIGGTSVQKTDVEHLVIGSGVSSIGSEAFKGCTNLKTASLSNDVRSMGASAFYDCTSLTTINIPQNEDFTRIQNDAFSGCNKLTTITLPNNVATIGDRSFYGCSGLTSVDLGLVEAIGTWAFYNCSSLTTISLPTTLTLQNIGDNAFASCTSLQTVRTYYFNQDNFGNRVFSSTMKGVIIPSLITNITKAEIFSTFPSIENKGDVFYEGTKSKCEQVFNENFNDTKSNESIGGRNKTTFGNTSYIHWLCTAIFDMQGIAPNPAPVTNVWAGWDSVRWVLPPIVEGYEFGGWYWDEACTEFFGIRKDKDGSLINPYNTYTPVKETRNADIIPGDVTLYAKWIPTYYFEVAFDTRGKCSPPSSQEIPLNKTAKEPGVLYYYNKDDDKDYYIEGWYTDEGCTQHYDFNTPVDHSFTLYAKWAVVTTAPAHATITTTGSGAGCTVTLTDAKGRTYGSGALPPGLYTVTITPAHHYSFSGSITFIDRETSGGSQTGSETTIGIDDDGGSSSGAVPVDEQQPVNFENVMTTASYQINLMYQDAIITVNYTEEPVYVKIVINPADGGTVTGNVLSKDNVLNGVAIVGAGEYEYKYDECDHIIFSPRSNEGYSFGTVILTKKSRNESTGLAPASATSITYYDEQDVQYTPPYSDKGGKVDVVCYEFVFYKVLNIGTPMTDLHLKEGYTSGNVLTFDATAEGDRMIDSYQWYKNSTNSKEGATAIEGANSASYTIPTGKTAGTTEYYYCEVKVMREDKKNGSTFSRIVAVTISAADAPEPATYGLSGDYVVFYHENDYTPITKAAEGETVKVSFNPYDPEDAEKVIIPSGKYFTGNYTSADGVIFTPIEGNTDATFVMPAKAVTVSAVLADQEEFELDLTTNEPQVIPESIWQLLYRLNKGINVYDDQTGERFLDLNLDGSRDVLLEEDYDEATEVSIYRATRQAGADAIKTDLRFDLTYDIPLQYNSVLFNLVVNAVDLVKAIAAGKPQAEINEIVSIIMQKKQ